MKAKIITNKGDMNFNIPIRTMTSNNQIYIIDVFACDPLLGPLSTQVLTLNNNKLLRVIFGQSKTAQAPIA